MSLLAVTNHAVKRALPEVDPTQPAKLIPFRGAANNLSRCEGHLRALAVYQSHSLRDNPVLGTLQSKNERNASF